MVHTPLQRAVEIVGGQSALARKLGVSQAHVWHWLHRGKNVPAEHAIAIEKATDGNVTRSELRPDIYPPEESAPADEDADAHSGAPPKDAAA